MAAVANPEVSKVAEFVFNKDAIEKIGKEAVNKVRPAMQSEIDKLGRSHKGKPEDQIKRELKSRFPGMNDTALKDSASAIADGKPVKFT